MVDLAHYVSQNIYDQSVRKREDYIIHLVCCDANDISINLLQFYSQPDRFYIGQPNRTPGLSVKH